MTIEWRWTDWRHPVAQVIIVALISGCLSVMTASHPSMLHIIWMVTIPLVAGLVLNRRDGCVMAALLVCASLTAVVIVRSFGPSYDAPKQFLPREPGVQYRTILSFWDDPELAFRPFELEVRTRDAPEFDKHILFAEQCEDVGVVQTQEILYVFYKEIALTSFDGLRPHRAPKPILCDLGLPHCLIERDRLLTDGAKLIRVCPSRNPDGTPGP